MRPLAVLLVLSSLVLAGCSAPTDGARLDVDPELPDDDPPLLGGPGPTTLEVDLYPLARTSSGDPPVGPMSFATLGKERRGFVVRESGDAEHVLVGADRSGAPYHPLVEAHGGLHARLDNPAWWSKSAYLLSWPGTTGGDNFLVDPYNVIKERHCDGGKTVRTLWGALPEKWKCSSVQDTTVTTITAGAHNVRHWTPGYVRAAPFVSGGSPYHEVFFQKADGWVAIEQMEKTTSVERYRAQWSTHWDTFIPYVSGGAFHVLSYSSTTGAAALDRFTPSATGPALTLTPVWSETWTPGWKGFAVLDVGDGVSYVACHPQRAECVLDKVAHDGTLTTLARTEVTFRTDDVKTLGPMPYSGDGTASLVVRNGDLWTELVFYTDPAKADKARAPRPAAGAFEHSGGGMRMSGKLFARSAAGEPPASGMSWVHGKDQITGYASLGALAQQIVVVPREPGAGGPPDAFKFPTLWGERYGGLGAYATQLNSVEGTYELFVDPYFPVFGSFQSDGAVGYLEAFEDGMILLKESVEDPNGVRSDDSQPRTRLTLRTPTGELRSAGTEAGLVRAHPLEIHSFGHSVHFLLMQKNDGSTVVHRVTFHGEDATFGLTPVYRGNWAQPWEVFHLYWVGGEPFLFSYAPKTGAAAVDKLNFASDWSSLGFEPVWSATWQKGWEGFALLDGSRGDIAWTYAACNFIIEECVVDDVHKDHTVHNAARLATRGKVAPLDHVTPGYRLETGKAHLVGWRGGTGWIDVTIERT